MEHVLEIEDRYYILADSPLADQRTLVLKRDDVFAVFNASGDIEPVGHSAQGIYLHDMRHLSRWQLFINGQRPIVLSARVTNDNSRIIIDLTNPDMHDQGRIMMPRGTLHVSRTRLLWRRRCYERVAISNFGLEPVPVRLSMTFAADFADIFEIRGTSRPRRGMELPVQIRETGLSLGYVGLDDVHRRTSVACEPAPDRVNDDGIVFEAELRPRQRSIFGVSIHCQTSDEASESKANRIEFSRLVKRLTRHAHDIAGDCCRVESSNVQLNAWLRRSYADLDMLLTRTENGVYPYAGVPWFSAAFGRDGIITALQLMWVNPAIARGVLEYLARTQAVEEDPSRDAEPGKILHERRTDEMSRLREVPFGDYYGSVDATPLFIILANAYYGATGDLEFIKSIWPNVERALAWIDRYGDVDGDGFVEYACKSSNGLGNQGWKDSHDAVFHADGELATAPIALCEVQAYVFQAKLGAANLARVLERRPIGEVLTAQAQRLQERFNAVFWLEDLGTYALALDNRKRQCRVQTSNPGHCLFSGIVPAERADQLARNLMSRQIYSGWGIRTVASNELRYNPMSYHSGSIWPHDNAMIAQGLAKYGHSDGAMRLFKGWFDASTFLDLHRLPELCCGFGRRRGKGPTPYPVACSPQAWAAGSVFMFINACMGMSIDGCRKQILIRNPRLPPMVDNVKFHDLQVGTGRVSLVFHREKGDVGVLVTRRDDDVSVLVSK